MTEKERLIFWEETAKENENIAINIGPVLIFFP